MPNERVKRSLKKKNLTADKMIRNDQAKKLTCEAELWFCQPHGVVDKIQIPGLTQGRS